MFSALTSLSTSKKTTTLSKAGLWTAYATTDVYPTGHAHAGKIWDIYSNCYYTYSTGQCGNVGSTACVCYNREHTVPQDWLGSSDYSNAAAKDIVHIFPTDGKVNGLRSSYALGETNAALLSASYGSAALGRLGTSKRSSYSGTVYEPDDEYKGDLARVYMYMRMHYATSNIAQGTYGTVHFTTTTAASTATNYGMTDYSVELLMEWHRNDPVSQKEIDRNNAIESVQGNRNPFVDYPCLAEYLWGTKKGSSFSLSSVKGSFESGFTVDGCDGCSTSCSGGGTTTNYTITWVVNGSTYATNTSNGTSIATFPTDPSAPTTCSSKVFVGWSTTNIGSTEQSSAPSVLFTSSNTSSAPSIDSNKTFYAVFATATSGGSSSTISFEPSDFNGQGTSGSGSSMSSTKSGVSLSFTLGYGTTQIRTYAGGTFTFASSSSISGITITTNTSKGTAEDITLSSGGGTYTGSSTTGTWSGSSTSITFANASKQVQITAISVTIGGGTSYSGYVTSCSSSSSCTSNPTLGAASSGTTTTTTAPATCSNGITSLGSTGCTISSYGFVYGTSSNPTLDNGTKVQVGTSYTTTGTSFNTTITGLTAGTTYYIRPYATNGNGTGYGSQTNVTTKSLPTYTITWSVNGTTSTVTYNEGESLVLPSTPSDCSSTRVFMGWTETSGYSGSTAPSNMFTTASGTVTANKTYYAVYANKTTTGGSGSSTVTDALTYSLIGLGTVSSGNATYTDFTGVSATSDAVYAGNINKFNSSSNPTNVIQLRSSGSNSGIVTTTTGGTATNVTVSWNASTADTRTLNVYGKTSAYSAATDLYLSSTQGTLIGTIVKGTSTSLDITGNYTYIGVRSNGSAMYLDELDITWSSGGSGTITYSNYSTSCTTTPTTYNITYKDQGGGTFSGTHGSGYPTTHTYGTATTLVSPTKTGYDFGGWFTTSACTGTAVTTLGATAYTADITLYAKWTAKSYNITYKDQGNATFSGTHGSGYPTTHTYGTVTTLVNPTKTGYDFAGWFTNSNCTGTAVTTLGATAYTADITLYAKWTAKSYNITYKDQGNATFSGTHGSGYPTTHTYGTATTLVSPTKTGYTFGGWFTNSNCTGTAITTLGATAYTADITLYAKWTQNTYNFTIAATPTGYGSVSTTSITGIPHGSSVTTNGNKFTVNGTTVTATPATATAQYTYAFSQWNNLPTTVTANVTNVQAVFTRTTNTYTVTFDANGHGTAPSAITGVEYNSTITAPTEPTAAGWAFGGWYKESGCTNAWNFTSDKVTGNTVLYAKWTALPTYTVTFIDGTSTYDTRSGYTGQSITVTDPTPCSGFTFEGWSTQQYNSTNTGYPTIDYDGTVPSSNTTYYAVYSIQRATTTLVANKFEKITSLNELTSGNYLVVGNNGSTNRAMVAATTNYFYLNTASVTSISNIITNSTTNRIWQINAAGNHVTFYNAYTGKYVQLVPEILGIADVGSSFSASVSGGSWTFTSDTDTGYKLHYFSTDTRFGSYSTAGTTIHLYKQQTQTTYTTYYTTDTSFTIEANPNNTTYGSTSITEL